MGCKLNTHAAYGGCFEGMEFWKTIRRMGRMAPTRFKIKACGHEWVASHLLGEKGIGGHLPHGYTRVTWP